jgi:hypothetical protein
MYAAHFAAGLAIKSRAPKAPTWALLTGAFLPDLIWIGLGLAGVEPSQGAAFFDDWSHSFASILVWATVYSLLFLRRGMAVAFPVWLAVFSHFLLDLPIHPKDLALYPHSALHLGWGLWNIGRTNYWYVQFCVLMVLIWVYARGAAKQKFSGDLIAANCVLLLGLHLMNW